MLKILHVSFALLSVITFISRVFLENSHAEFFAQKPIKIAPHVISTLLLLTGFALVVQGGWLAGEFGWIVAKIFALVAYIGLGLLAVKSQGKLRWQAFAGAMACFVYILAVAGTKNPLVFL